MQDRLNALSPQRLAGMRRGIEKESLRANADATLAMTPHPAALGSALTHPHITTDFSESQVELVTGAHTTVQACMDQLDELHQLSYRAIGEERLWVDSMPCKLPADGEIPLGQYGTSNVGLAKTVYRQGLSHRYGRRMQTISGIHYNWSLPGLSNDEYFALIRNFRRHSFLLLWLFGASPAVTRCFVSGQPHELQALGEHTLYLPHATSLRMGRLGYQSDAQSSLSVSYNGLDGYAASLQEALTRPYAAYEAIGIQDEHGEYRQLSTTLLQIENEFYGTIRPKRTIATGERPLHALRQRGVEYVEVRCMDLDPFEPAGIRAETGHFIDTFLLHCLLSDSPPDTPQELSALARNRHRTAARGREPGLQLERGDGLVTLTQWAAELLEQLAPVARSLDAALGGDAHQSALQMATARLQAPETT
ncbi:glutamate--cysteine ligase, partial [Ideonella sp.]|uniref:glutamate--cysteine ligase n=1 Tax=Ideonella sp. TaxID=1929293 RepID=UPI003BB76E57